MRLRRDVGVLGALVASMVLAATARADVDYVDYAATYRKVATQALPTGVASYQVTVDEGSGIRPEHIVITGLERVDDNADLHIHVSAGRAEIVEANLQSFSGQIAATYDGQRSPPYLDYTIYWHDIVLAQSASVSVELLEEGWAAVSSPPLGTTLRRDTGKPDAMRTGVIQICAGPRCVMQGDYANTSDSAVKRANYLVETFSTDVTQNGFPVVTNGRARAEKLLDDIRKALDETPENPAAGMTTTNINQWLEANFGFGDRSMNLVFAVARGDTRFNDAIATLGAGDDAERSTRRLAAMEAFRAVVEDEKATARTRAAAMYNLAGLHGIEGQLTDAQETLRLAELENLKQRDRRLGTKHGQILSGRMVELAQVLAKLNPAPAMAAVPVMTPEALSAP